MSYRGLPSSPKPYFSTFNVAGDETNAETVRAEYQEKRNYIRTTRSLRRMCKRTAIDPQHNAQQAMRAGYPTRRVRDDNIPSKRGKPFHRHSDRYKRIFKNVITHGLLSRTCKVMVLHVTRGWKRFA